MRPPSAARRREVALRPSRSRHVLVGSYCIHWCAAQPSMHNGEMGLRRLGGGGAKSKTLAGTLEMTQRSRCSRVIGKAVIAVYPVRFTQKNERKRSRGARKPDENTAKTSTTEEVNWCTKL